MPNTNWRALVSLGELNPASENYQLGFTTDTEKFCDKPFVCWESLSKWILLDNYLIRMSKHFSWTDWTDTEMYFVSEKSLQMEGVNLIRWYSWVLIYDICTPGLGECHCLLHFCAWDNFYLLLPILLVFKDMNTYSQIPQQTDMIIRVSAI